MVRNANKQSCNQIRLVSLCFLILGLFFSGCNPKSYDLEPCVIYTPGIGCISRLPSPFTDLSEHEISTDWGKEVLIANQFAKEMDLYRAITGYKRALFILPEDQVERRREIHFHILQCYYLGNKYYDVIEYFQESDLTQISSQFPALRELLLILNDSYEKLGYEDRAEHFLNILEKGDEVTASNLRLSHAITQGDLCGIQEHARGHPEQEEFQEFLTCYCKKSKSISTAQTLNAILPGAGYYYIGQKRSALTSFLLNASFIYSAIWFFDQGNIGAGVITTSLEMGWYLGGINGAGLGAKHYNETLYNCGSQELMIRNHLFPVLMWETAF